MKHDRNTGHLELVGHKVNEGFVERPDPLLPSVMHVSRMSYDLGEDL